MSVPEDSHELNGKILIKSIVEILSRSVGSTRFIVRQCPTIVLVCAFGNPSVC